MKTSVQLKQERQAKIDAAQALINTANAEKREMSDAEQTSFDGLHAEITKLDGEIQRAENVEAMERRAADKAPKLGTPEERELRQFSVVKLLRSAASGHKPEGFEREMCEEAQKEFRTAGAPVQNPDGHFIPEIILRSQFGPREKRDMTVLGGSPAGVEGGYNVATEVDGYVAALRERNLLMDLGAGFMSGLVGNVDMPRENAVAAFAWEGETDTTAETSPTYKKISFKPERLAGFIDVSKQLLTQTSPSIEARVREQILLGHATALDIAGFKGTGANDQPYGIIADSDVTVIAIGTDGGAITRALVLQMEETLSGANGLINPVFITTNKNRRKMKTIALDGGSGLFLWDRLDKSVEGYMAFATNNLPSDLTKGTGTALSAAILGTINPNTLSFGMWGGLEILVNPYTKAKEGITEMVINSYCDFHVLQPGAFAVIKDIVTT